MNRKEMDGHVAAMKKAASGFIDSRIDQSIASMGTPLEEMDAGGRECPEFLMGIFARAMSDAYDDLFARYSKDIVSGILGRGDMMGVHGLEPFLACVQLAAHLAAHRPFFGIRSPRPLRCLVLEGERPTPRVSEVASAALAALQIGDDARRALHRMRVMGWGDPSNIIAGDLWATLVEEDMSHKGGDLIVASSAFSEGERLNRLRGIAEKFGAAVIASRGVYPRGPDIHIRGAGEGDGSVEVSLKLRMGAEPSAKGVRDGPLLVPQSGERLPHIGGPRAAPPHNVMAAWAMLAGAIDNANAGGVEVIDLRGAAENMISELKKAYW